MNEIHEKDNSTMEITSDQQPQAEEAGDEAQAQDSEDNMPPESDIEAQKKRLEVEKLQAEVDEITGRTRGASAIVARWSGITGLLVTILGLGAGGAGLYYGYQDFSTRSENESLRRARQLDFEVGREIIELSQNLSDADKTKRTGAAILLSSYEEHSVPILVANLHTEDQALAGAIVRSLGLILEKPRLREKPELVAGPLIEETEILVAGELKKSGPNTLAMSTFIDALGKLFAGSQNKAVLDALQRLETLVHQDSLDAALRAKLHNVERKINQARSAVSGS